MSKRVMCVLGVLGLLVSAPLAYGVGSDGTWTNTSGGSWDLGTNWSGGTIADGSNYTADFSTLNIANATVAVTLDTARTIGYLKFGDTGGGYNSGSWQIAHATNILTLDTGGAGTPTISNKGNASNSDCGAYMDVVLAGTEGVAITKVGTNRINPTFFRKANTLTGGISVENGGKLAATVNGAFSSNTVTVKTGGTLYLRDSVTIWNNFVLENGATLGIEPDNAYDANCTHTGTITLDSGTANITADDADLTLDGVIGENVANCGLSFGGTGYGSYQEWTIVNGVNTFTGLVNVGTKARVIVTKADGLGTGTGAVTVSGVSGNSQEAYLSVRDAAGLNANRPITVGTAGILRLGEGVTMGNTVTLSGGMFGFDAANSGDRFHNGSIILTGGTTSYVDRSNGYGTWYQTGIISGDGALYIMGYNSYDTTLYFNGDNRYTGGTIAEKQSNEKQTYVGHNNAFGTGPVQLRSDADTKEAFRLNANLEMPNAFRGRGKIGTGSYVLTATGSFAPRDTGLSVVTRNIGTMYVEDLKFGSDSDGCDYNWDYGYVNTAAAADPPVYERKNDLIATETLEFGTAAAVLNLGTWIDESGGLYPDPEPDDYVLFTYTGADPTLPAWTINNVPAGMIAEVRLDVDNSQVILALERPPIPEPGALSLLGLGLLGLKRRRR